MEGFFVLDSNNDDVLKDNHKMEKEARVSFGSSARKKLVDISNTAPRSSSSSLGQDNKARESSFTMRDYIQHLQKENSTLVKLLADRNKLIELSGAELHNLKVSLQKMQQQNLHLAQTNSQMLAELNSCKDMLKDMQHQLGCKNAVLAAKRSELERFVNAKACHTVDSKKVKVTEHEQPVAANRDNDKPFNTTRRQKSKSLGPSVKKDEDNDASDNGRIRARRQSASFRLDEPKPDEDLFRIDNGLLGDGDRMQEDDSQGRKSLVSRPSREAAKKVQSYKEMDIKAKMRRPE